MYAYQINGFEVFTKFVVQKGKASSIKVRAIMTIAGNDHQAVLVGSEEWAHLEVDGSDACSGANRATLAALGLTVSDDVDEQDDYSEREILEKLLAAVVAGGQAALHGRSPVPTH